MILKPFFARFVARFAAPLVGYLSGLRFPVLFAVTATLFLFDLLIPDFIPLADEILLGLLTALLGKLKRGPHKPGR